MNELERAASNELLFSYASLSKETFRLSPNAEFTYDRNAMLNMFRKGAQWQAKQSPWIDFHHQMPVENQLVLVQAGYRQNVIHLVTYHDGEFYENGKEVNFVGDWMPIPELPKE